MINSFLNSKKYSHLPGLTLVECIVTFAIIAIISLIAIPSIISIVPTAQLRTSARMTNALFNQGRALAQNSQKPTRIIIADCRAAAPAGRPRPCQTHALNTGVFNIVLETSSFNDDGTFEDWIPATGEYRQALHRNVIAEQAITAPPQVEYPDTPTGVFWAVFMPSGDKYTSHFDKSDGNMKILMTHSRLRRSWNLTIGSQPL